MNCKPGDLVMVIRSEVGNEGRFGTVRCRATADCGLHVYATDDWIVDGRFKTADEVAYTIGGHELCRFDVNQHEVSELPFPDAWLRPIRPDEGDDETLAWAGKPAGIVEPAKA